MVLKSSNNGIIQVLENQQLSVCPKSGHNYKSWACAICLEDNFSIQARMHEHLV